MTDVYEILVKSMEFDAGLCYNIFWNLLIIYGSISYMSLNVKRERPAKGLAVNYICDDKFSSESVRIDFFTPLDEIMSQRYTLAISILTESCKKYPEKSALTKRLLSLYGASLSNFSVRTGNYLSLGLKIESISDMFAFGGEKVTSDCAQLLLDCLFEPDMHGGLFDEKVFERKKRQLCEAIKKDVNNRRAYAISRAREIAFCGERNSVKPKGELAAALALTNSQIAQAYRMLLEKSFIMLTFCGKGASADAQELVCERILEFVKSRSGDVCDITDMQAASALKPEPKYVSEKYPQSQSKLIMFFKNGGGESFYADRLAAALFGGTSFSKLFMNVREKLSLCYYCSANMIECMGAMIVDSGVEPGNEEKAAGEIVSQLRELQNGSFTDEELENTKRFMRSMYRINCDCAGDLDAWYYYQFVRNTLLSPDDAAEMIGAVSRNEVIAAAKRFSLDTVYISSPSDISSGGDSDV